jgi:hypothetical protein
VRRGIRTCPQAAIQVRDERRRQAVACGLLFPAPPSCSATVLLALNASGDAVQLLHIGDEGCAWIGVHLLWGSSESHRHADEEATVTGVAACTHQIETLFRQPGVSEGKRSKTLS